MNAKLFDPEDRPLFTPKDFYGERGDSADACIIVFSKEIYSSILDRFDCEKVGDMFTCGGSTPICVFKYEDIRVAFYLSGIGSAIAGHQVIESNWITGAETYVMFGSAGTLREDLTQGRYVIPDRAFRGEGMSAYYAPPGDYIEVRNARAVKKCFEELGLPNVTGAVWTVDAFYRESERLCDERRAEGCIAVEMELAGVQAVCDHHGLQLYDFLETGDVLRDESAAEPYSVGSLSAANHDAAKLEIALEIIIRSQQNKYNEVNFDSFHECEN